MVMSLLSLIAFFVSMASTAGMTVTRQESVANKVSAVGRAVARKEGHSGHAAAVTVSANGDIQRDRQVDSRRHGGKREKDSKPKRGTGRQGIQAGKGKGSLGRRGKGVPAESVQVDCSETMCPMAMCPGGTSRRQIGSDCCACDPPAPVQAATVQVDCSDTMCPWDMCPDGTSRRQIGSDCCACDPPAPVQAATVQVDCSDTMCSTDMCPGGTSRRQIGSDCCACDPPTSARAAPLQVDCSNTVCTMVMCRDGNPQRQIGNDCCACDDTPTQIPIKNVQTPVVDMSPPSVSTPDLVPGGGNARTGKECCPLNWDCGRDELWADVGGPGCPVGEECVFLGEAGGPPRCQPQDDVVARAQPTQTDCSDVWCSMALCPDGKSQRQIGNECCACDTSEDGA